MSNGFMAASKKKTAAQAAIQNGDADKKVCINVRVDESMRQKMRVHYCETGENQTALINRLLRKELG